MNLEMEIKIGVKVPKEGPKRNFVSSWFYRLKTEVLEFSKILIITLGRKFIFALYKTNEVKSGRKVTLRTFS